MLEWSGALVWVVGSSRLAECGSLVGNEGRPAGFCFQWDGGRANSQLQFPTEGKRGLRFENASDFGVEAMVFLGVRFTILVKNV